MASKFATNPSQNLTPVVANTFTTFLSGTKSTKDEIAMRTAIKTAFGGQYGVGACAIAFNGIAKANIIKGKAYGLDLPSAETVATVNDYFRCLAIDMLNLGAKMTFENLMGCRRTSRWFTTQYKANASGEITEAILSLMASDVGPFYVSHSEKWSNIAYQVQVWQVKSLYKTYKDTNSYEILAEAVAKAARLDSLAKNRKNTDSTLLTDLALEPEMISGSAGSVMGLFSSEDLVKGQKMLKGAAGKGRQGLIGELGSDLSKEEVLEFRRRLKKEKGGKK